MQELDDYQTLNGQRGKMPDLEEDMVKKAEAVYRPVIIAEGHTRG